MIFALRFLKAMGADSTVLLLVKVLGRGECTKKFNVKAHKFSQSAQKAIEAAGGTVEVICGST